MDRSEFFKAVCLHYGKASTHEGKPVRIPREYDEVIGKDVAEWIRAYAVTHEDFQPLFDELKGRYSANYGKLPDRPQLQSAADALEIAPAPEPREPPPELTDTDAAAVVAGLAEIMDMARKGRVGAARERRDPYAREED